MQEVFCRLVVGVETVRMELHSQYRKHFSNLSHQTTSMHSSAANALADAVVCGDPMRKQMQDATKPPSTCPLAGMNSREEEAWVCKN